MCNVQMGNVMKNWGLAVQGLQAAVGSVIGAEIKVTRNASAISRVAMFQDSCVNPSARHVDKFDIMDDNS
jgi:hypothetical protein